MYSARMLCVANNGQLSNEFMVHTPTFCHHGLCGGSETNRDCFIKSLLINGELSLAIFSNEMRGI